MTNNQQSIQSSPGQQRLRELFAISRQRYLEAGGRSTGHADGNRYMTAEEKQEFFAIARSLRQTPTPPEPQRKTQAQVSSSSGKISPRSR